MKKTYLIPETTLHELIGGEALMQDSFLPFYNKDDDKLYTVHPLIHKYCAVYRENARQYCTVTTDAGHRVTVMQVGALGVGKIVNENLEAASVKQGEEQGHFEFGGSTILVLAPGGSYRPEQILLDNTANGFETIVKMGERIGGI